MGIVITEATTYHVPLKELETCHLVVILNVAEELPGLDDSDHSIVVDFLDHCRYTDVRFELSVKGEKGKLRIQDGAQFVDELKCKNFTVCGLSLHCSLRVCPQYPLRICPSQL